MTTEMTCVLCGAKKAYPDGFPNLAMAECWQCIWERHIRGSHPEIVRRVRRDVKKRAKRLSEIDLMKAATEAEKALIRKETP